MQGPPNMPQFGQVPILGQQPQQQQPTQQQQQQQLQAHVQAAMGQASLNIYTQLAIIHATERDKNDLNVNPELLRQFAKESQVAARCYFESIGILKQEDQGDYK